MARWSAKTWTDRFDGGWQDGWGVPSSCSCQVLNEGCGLLLLLLAPPAPDFHCQFARQGWFKFFLCFCVRTIRNGHVMFPLPTNSPIEGPPIPIRSFPIMHRFECFAHFTLGASKRFEAIDRKYFLVRQLRPDRKREVVRCNAYFHGCLHGRSSQNVCT